MRKWIEEIDKTTKDFQETFGDLNSEQLNWNPDPETWSIAQNIDHLIVINTSYFPVIKSIKKGTYKTPILGRIGFVVWFFGKTVLSAVQPDRKKKMKTFPIWEPTKSKIPDGDGEYRLIRIGKSEAKFILLVVYTVRGLIVRLISARQANKDERNLYIEEKIKNQDDGSSNG